MTWGDGTSTLICELCGHINKPEEAFWYEGEVAICKDEAACKLRESKANMTSEFTHIEDDEPSKDANQATVRKTKARGTFPVIDVYDKNPNQYLDKARHLVLEHYNHHFLDVGEELHISEVYVVWFAKTLQNWKALVATEVANDGVYFEVTYNGDLKETYLDVYSKVSNSVIPDTGPIEMTSNLTVTPR